MCHKSIIYMAHDQNSRIYCCPTYQWHPSMVATGLLRCDGCHSVDQALWRFQATSLSLPSSRQNLSGSCFDSREESDAFHQSSVALSAQSSPDGSVHGRLLKCVDNASPGSVPAAAVTWLRRAAVETLNFFFTSIDWLHKNFQTSIIGWFPLLAGRDIPGLPPRFL